MLHGEVLQVTREMKRYSRLCAACNAPLIQTFSWVFASLHSSMLNSRNLAFIFRLILKFWIAKDRVGTNIIWFNYIRKLSIFEIFWYILYVNVRIKNILKRHLLMSLLSFSFLFGLQFIFSLLLFISHLIAQISQVENLKQLKRIAADRYFSLREDP